MYRLPTAMLAALAFFAGDCSLAETVAIRLSEPVASTDTYEDFGAALPATLSPRSLRDVLADPSVNADEDVTVTARIEQVCQKKGCFFIAQDGETVARVVFKEYSFFVPTDSSGKTVTFVGRVQQNELSADDAAHLDKDLKAEPGTNRAGTETLLIASAVRIPR
ncbi:MAG: DUF4920 domain-containing protein [Pseudomonadota bacterium]